MKNNFPQLPFREDGPYLVWIGILKDDQMLQTQFQPLVKRFLESLSVKNFLKAEPELIILEPTSHSRLRWIADEEKETNQHEVSEPVSKSFPKQHRFFIIKAIQQPD